MSTALDEQPEVAADHDADLTERGLDEHARPHATSAVETRAVSLPLLATDADVRELASSLRKKPAGITAVQALNSDQRRLFDERKIAAYKCWGLLEQDDDRLRLTSFGGELALQLRREAEAYRTILHRVGPYRAALHWIHEEALEIVSSDLVAALWRRLYPDASELRDARTAKGSVTSFFHLCQAADLGVVTLGKRGQPTRMRADGGELTDWIEFSRRTPESPALTLLAGRDDLTHTPPSRNGNGERVVRTGGATRIYISHRQGDALLRQVRDMLHLIDAQGVVVRRDGRADGFIPGHVLASLRMCRAAILIIGDADLCRDAAGGLVLDEQIKIELSAACALHSRQIVVLWQSQAPPPEELGKLSQLHRLGDSLSWGEGLQLMNSVKELCGLAAAAA